MAVVVGLLAGAALVLFDLATRRLLPPMKASGAQLAEALSHTNLPSILASLLYGGITEELMLRWGLMTILAWFGWRLVEKGDGVPNHGIMWTAIALQALVFGALHLPATALLFELTPFLIVRALLLNGIFALTAGWLYWRRSLEAAMVAHLVGHVVLTAVNQALAANWEHRHRICFRKLLAGYSHYLVASQFRVTMVASANYLFSTEDPEGALVNDYLASIPRTKSAPICGRDGRLLAYSKHLGLARECS